MSAKLATAVVMSFAAGYMLHVAISQRDGLPCSIEGHWRVVNSYRAQLMNPTNSHYDATHNFGYSHLPPDPEPSLFALVNAGELEHVDLVLPNVAVSKQANSLWMEFVNNHDDVLHGIGNPRHVHYAPTGTQPMHLNLWFKPSARESVQQLIKDLEALDSN